MTDTAKKWIGASGLTLEEDLLFDKSSAGRQGFPLPPLDVPVQPLESMVPVELIRSDIPNFPELSEVDVVRHYTRLSSWNYNVDLGFYPLGSCTMKYNPRVNERIAGMTGFAGTHPLQPAEQVQGNLKLMYELAQCLCEISGMDAVSLQPAAGAHGELTGIMVIKAYHKHRGEAQRTQVLIPNSAHGTNPASAALCGFETVELATDERGNLNLDSLKQHLSDKVAALMVTNPNTLGLFEENILEISKLVHDSGALLYCDGANFNALMGITKVGDWGVDVLHFNLHKTFSTPHGGGGPGSGPIGVKKHLEPFLPVPRINIKSGYYELSNDFPLTVGKITTFYGNFGVMVRAYAYIRTMGAEGLKRATELAVVNANYIKERLKEAFYLPYDRICKHEVVLTDKCQNQCGIKTMDVAKRLMDYGFHPPTVYFPLIVHGAIMIEPTETESLADIDRFIEAMIQIAEEAAHEQDKLHEAPHNTFRARLDDTKAARNPILRWEPGMK